MPGRRTRYPSDVSDRTWGQIAALLPRAPQRGRPRTTPLRDVVDALNYRWRTGCAWRMLPHDFPPWETIYAYASRWERDGTLRRIRDVLLSGSIRRRIDNEHPAQLHRASAPVASRFRGDSDRRIGDRA